MKRETKAVINREQGLNPGAMVFPAGAPPVSLRLASDWQRMEFIDVALSRSSANAQ